MNRIHRRVLGAVQSDLFRFQTSLTVSDEQKESMLKYDFNKCVIHA